LVDRIFGAPRAVVVMAFRRTDKNRDLGASPGIRAILQKIEEEKLDQATFLLIRDGQKIWKVDLPEFLTALPRMFPTPADLDAPYKDSTWYYSKEPARTIGQDSTKYAEAVEEFRKLSLQYERLLLVLWGLHDRLNIFGPFVKPSDYQSFADPRLQQERFVMVMDDQFMIGPNRPSYKDWIVDNNKTLKPGSRIIAVWRNIMTPDTAPMAVTTRRGNPYSDAYDFKYAPDFMSNLVTVKREGAKLYVEAPVHREIWDYGGNGPRMRHINAKVTLTESSYSSRYDKLGILVIDDVDYEDLDFYLNSRSQRVHYIKYAAVLVAARDVLKAEMLEDQPAAAWLQAAARSARFYETQDQAQVDRAIRKTLRAWRTEKGGAPPEIDSPKWPVAAQTLLSKVWHSLGAGQDEALIDNVKALVEDVLHETPIRLVRDGMARLVCYTQPNENVLAREIEMIQRWPFINRHVLSVMKDGQVKKIATTEVVPIPEVAGETPVEVFAPALSEAKFKFGMSPGILRNSLDLAESLFKLPSVLLRERPMSEEDIKFLGKEARYTTLKRRNVANRADLLLPIGLGVFEEKDDWENKTLTRSVGLWCLSEDAFLFLGRHSEMGREKAVAEINYLYPNPGRMLSFLPEAGATGVKPTFFLSMIPLKRAYLERIADEINKHGYALQASELIEHRYASLPAWSETMVKLKNPDAYQENIKSIHDYASPDVLARLDHAFADKPQSKTLMRA
jgi:hypothetical protein